MNPAAGQNDGRLCVGYEIRRLFDQCLWRARTIHRPAIQTSSSTRRPADFRRLHIDRQHKYRRAGPATAGGNESGIEVVLDAVRALQTPKPFGDRGEERLMVIFLERI